MELLLLVEFQLYNLKVFLNIDLNKLLDPKVFENQNLKKSKMCKTLSYI